MIIPAPPPKKVRMPGLFTSEFFNAKCLGPKGVEFETNDDTFILDWDDIAVLADNLQRCVQYKRYREYKASEKRPPLLKQRYGARYKNWDGF